MDAAHLTQILAVTGAAVLVCRFVATTFARAETGIEVLFVPPDRTLGWPRGVQESDEPWGWHPPASAPSEVLDAAGSAPDAIPEPPPDTMPRAGRFVVEPRSVAPVTFRTKPH